MSEYDNAHEVIRPSGQFYTFDRVLAEAYGIEEALVIHHLQYWISLNKRTAKNLHDGKTWMYSTYQEIAEHFTILNRRQVRHAIDNLVKFNVIKKGNYNKLDCDCTIWFSFVNEDIFCPNSKPALPRPAINEDTPPLPKLAGGCQNWQGAAKIGTAIPNTKPDTKPYNKTTNHKESKTQGEGLVGGFLKEEIKIHECLREIDIPEKDKFRLSEKFNEEIVKRSIAHCTKPGFKIQTSLDSSIFYFCKNPDHITENKKEKELRKLQEDDIRREKERDRYYIACKVASELWHEGIAIGVRLIANVSDYLEISSDTANERLYYSNTNFVTLLTHWIKKLDLRMPTALKGCC